MDCGEELDEIPAMNFLIFLAAGFLFLKTGEKFATQESAGPTVAAFTDKLGGYEPHIFNDPGKALDYCTTGKPVVGIMTPGFYLAHAKALGWEAVLEVRRQNVPAERYVLVTKNFALAALTNQTIATPLATEPEFVRAVILQNQLGAVKLTPTFDVEGTVQDLVEGAKGAPAAVLMEEGLWQVIRADADLGPHLRVVFMSEELPGNLVVKMAGPLDTGKLKTALQATPTEILNSLRVAAFSEINAERLQKAEERFRAK